MGNKQILIYGAVLCFVFELSGISFSAAQLQMPSSSNDGIKDKVSALFFDAPTMVLVANCESGFRQFGPNGLPLRGGTGGGYIGVFQISESGHAQAALALGFDIHTVDGNLDYARYLYNKNGSGPWVSCVPKADAPSTVNASTSTVSILISPPVVPPATSSTATVASVTISTLITQPINSSGALTLNLQIGMADPQVVILQQKLNTAGFLVATSGPGSPGNETSKFGLLTRQAVMRLQCAKANICSGNESTTGYGRLGSLIRGLLGN